jgi:hypothetical protein
MAEKSKKAAKAAHRYQKDKMKCNTPQKAPPGDKHKKVVKSCHHGEEKIIRYGARGYEDYTQHKDAGRRANFRARHNCDSVTDKNTARYWACQDLWGLVLMVGLSSTVFSSLWNLLNGVAGTMS